MDCDKYVKKAKIVILLTVPIILTGIASVFFIINENFVKFIGFYGFIICFGGLPFILPYIQCLVDYNQSHKPPNMK